MIDTKILLNKFEPFIVKCRPGDWEHAKRVVMWVKKLGKNRADLDLIIIAGYIHDIGWSGLVPRDIKLSKVELLKLIPLADKQTISLVEQALKDLGLTLNEKNTIIRLIKASENQTAVHDDEMILIDADNLSKTTPEHVKQKYVKSDWLNICDLFGEKFAGGMKTEEGKKLFPGRLTSLRKALESDLYKSRI